jgi:hypothetical protein
MVFPQPIGKYNITYCPGKFVDIPVKCWVIGTGMGLAEVKSSNISTGIFHISALSGIIPSLVRFRLGRRRPSFPAGKKK